MNVWLWLIQRNIKVNIFYIVNENGNSNIYSLLYRPKMESCDDIDEECMRVLESCQDKFEDLNRKAVQVLEKEQRLNSFLD